MLTCLNTKSINFGAKTPSAPVAKQKESTATQTRPCDRSELTVSKNAANGVKAIAFSGLVQPFPTSIEKTFEDGSKITEKYVGMVLIESKKVTLDGNVSFIQKAEGIRKKENKTLIDKLTKFDENGNPLKIEEGVRLQSYSKLVKKATTYDEKGNITCIEKEIRNGSSIKKRTNFNTNGKPSSIAENILITYPNSKISSKITTYDMGGNIRFIDENVRESQNDFLIGKRTEFFEGEIVSVKEDYKRYSDGDFSIRKYTKGDVVAENIKNGRAETIIKSKDGIGVVQYDTYIDTH